MRDLFTSTVSGAAAFERARSEGMVDDDVPTPAELAEDHEERKRRIAERQRREAEERFEQTRRAYIEDHGRSDALADGFGEPGDYEEDEAA